MNIWPFLTKIWTILKDILSLLDKAVVGFVRLVESGAFGKQFLAILIGCIIVIGGFCGIMELFMHSGTLGFIASGIIIGIIIWRTWETEI